jgi:hypothetical protein
VGQTDAPDKLSHRLSSLLQPTPLATFLSAHWEKSPFSLRRNDESYYEALLTDHDLEDIISSPDARYPAIMLAKGGVYYPSQAYCDDVKMGHVTFSGVPNLKRLSAEYGRGATIALTSLDRTWKPLGNLCLRLQDELDHGINTNVYITAGQTSGFPPHYDTHDILVLQIGGRKRWRIYEPTISLPDPSQPCDPRGYSPGALQAEVELYPGDLLYLPRGYAHAATTSLDHSAHVTIGIHVYTWAGILQGLDPAYVQAKECRRALPPGFASRVELRPSMREQLKRLAPRHVTDANADRLLDGLIRSVNQSRRRTPPRFRSDAVVISMNTRLRVPPEHQYRLSRRSDPKHNATELTLEFGGNSFSFPPQLETVLHAMRSRGNFRLTDLPGEHDSAALIDLAGYLQSVGFLTPQA